MTCSIFNKHVIITSGNYVLLLLLLHTCRYVIYLCIRTENRAYGACPWTVSAEMFRASAHPLNRKCINHITSLSLSLFIYIYTIYIYIYICIEREREREGESVIIHIFISLSLYICLYVSPRMDIMGQGAPVKYALADAISVVAAPGSHANILFCNWPRIVRRW